MVTKTSNNLTKFNVFKIIFCASLFVTTNQVVAMENGIKEIFSKKLEKDIESCLPSNNGKFLFITYKDNTAELINIEGEELKKICHYENVKIYNFYNNNKILFIKHNNNSAKLINTVTGNIIYQIPDYSFGLFYSNSEKFFVERMDKSIELINIEAEELKKICKYENVKIYNFYNNNKILFIKHNNNSAKLINTETGNITYQIPDYSFGQFYSNSEKFFVERMDKSIELVETENGSVFRRLENVESCKFIDNCNFLFVRYKNSADLVDKKTGEIKFSLSYDDIIDYKFYENYKFLRVDRQEKSENNSENLKSSIITSVLFNMEKVTEDPKKRIIGSFVNVKEFLFCNNNVLVEYKDYSAELINLENGEKIGKKFENIHPDGYYYGAKNVSLSYDKKILYITFKDGSTNLIYTKSGRIIAKINKNDVYHLENNDTLLRIDNRETNSDEIINIETGKKIGKFTKIEHFLFLNKLLLARYRDNSAELINTDSGKIIRSKFENIGPGSKSLNNDKILFIKYKDGFELINTENCNTIKFENVKNYELHNNKKILIENKDGSTELINPENGTKVCNTYQKEDNIKDMLYLQNDTIFFIKYTYNSAKIVDIKNGNVIGKFTDIKSYSLENNNNLIIIKHSDDSVELINTVNGTEIIKLNDVYYLSLYNNYKLLFVEYNDHSKELLNLETKNRTGKLDGICNFLFYNNYKILFVECEDGSKIVINTETCNIIYKSSNNVYKYSFDNNCKFLFIEYKDASTELVNTETGKITYKISDFHSYQFCNNFKLLHISYKNGSIELINPENGDIIGKYKNTSNFSYRNNEKLLVIYYKDDSKDDLREFFNTDNFKTIFKSVKIEKHELYDNDKLLFVKYKDNSAEIINTETGAKVENKFTNIESCKFRDSVGNYYSSSYDTKKIIYLEQKKVMLQKNAKMMAVLVSAQNMTHNIFNNFKSLDLKYNDKVLLVKNEDETNDIFDVDNNKFLAKNNKYLKDEANCILSQDKDKTLKIFKVKNMAK